MENQERLEEVELDLTFVDDDGKVCVGQSVTDTIRNEPGYWGQRWVENAWGGGDLTEGQWGQKSACCHHR